MSPGYREWAPPPALRESVACLWTRLSPARADGSGGPAVTLVLPDACVDLIWWQGRGLSLAGPDTGPVPTAISGGTVLAGVRFRPGAGGPALRLPLSEVADRRVDVAGLGTSYAATLARRLPGSLGPAAALRLLTAAAAELVAEGPADPLVRAAAGLLARPAATAEQAAAALGVGERQLRRRCQAAAGYGPATLRRVLRFRRFLSALDAGQAAHPDGLAGLAACTGYADQAHLTRECTRLSGLTPAALAAARTGG